MHPIVYPIHIALNPTPEVAWIGIQTGFHDSREVTPHTICSCLVCGACEEGCCIAIFCSALVAVLGKKKVCFLVAEKSGTAWQKNDCDGFIVLLPFRCKTVASASRTNDSSSLASS